MSDTVAVDQSNTNQEINNLPMLASTTAYNTLDASEQKEFWIERVTNFSNGVTLTTAQQDLIVDLLDFLDSMDFSSADAQSDAETFLNTWVGNALIQFPTEVVGLLVATPIREYTDIIHFFNGDTPTYAVGPPPSGGGADNCNCNQSSSWGACQMIGDKCVEKTCDSHKGCGFLGLWTCNGDCNGGPSGGGGGVLASYYYLPNVTVSW